MCCSCCSVTQQKIWVFGLGIFCLLLGLLCTTGGPPLIRLLVRQQMVLEPGTRAYDKWQVTPIPVYLHMYLFNWTNADQARVSGVKPNFQQLGPYVFEQRTSKEDLTYYENGTASFRHKRVWTFRQEMSNGTLEDPITCPHLPSIAAASFMRNAPRALKFVFNTQLNANGGSLFQTHTANEWLFEGFDDKFLKYANSLPVPLPVNLGPYKERFGWFINRNGSKTFEGVFTIDTGANGLGTLGQIQLWKGKPNSGYFDDECGKLNGSTSDIYPPFLNHIDPITIFVVDTTRIINLYPTNKTFNVGGVEGVRYETNAETFDNGQKNSEMLCFCPKRLQPDNCPPSGASYLDGFGRGAPLYMSHPNFMFADPHYTDPITGINQNFERDIFTISIDRTLSIPLNVQANVQVSLKIERDNDLTVTRRLPDYFYAPMFIVSNKATMTEDLSRQVKLALGMPNIVRYIGYAFMLLGILLISIAGILTRNQLWREPKRIKKK